MALRSLEFETSDGKVLIPTFDSGTGSKDPELISPDSPLIKPTSRLYSIFSNEIIARRHFLPGFQEIRGKDESYDVEGQMQGKNTNISNPHFLYSLQWSNLIRGSFIYEGQILARYYNPSLTITRIPLPGIKAPHEQYSVRFFRGYASIRDEQIWGFKRNQTDTDQNPFDFDVSFNDQATIDRGYQLLDDFVYKR